MILPTQERSNALPDQMVRRNRDRRRAQISPREKVTSTRSSRKVLLLQRNSAAQQNRPLGRGTHVKGVCARAQFEVLDVTTGRDRRTGRAAREGNVRQAWRLSAIVRFGNSDPKKNSDFKADVRSLSFSVDLSAMAQLFPTQTWLGRISLCKTRRRSPSMTHPHSWRIMKLLTASNPASGLLVSCRSKTNCEC